jgi:hypothetical protein
MSRRLRSTIERVRESQRIERRYSPEEMARALEARQQPVSWQPSRGMTSQRVSVGGDPAQARYGNGDGELMTPEQVTRQRLGRD